MTTAARPPVTPKRTLNFLTPRERAPKTNVLLFGPPKRGKSTGAATAPGPILYLNAEPPNALDYPRSVSPEGHIREFPMLGHQSLSDAWLYLRDGGGGEKTVVVDTVAELWRVLVEEKSVNTRATLQQYGDVGTEIERFCRFLTRDCPMNVVLVCHEQYMDSPEGKMLMPQTGGQKNPMILASMVDVVGYVSVVEERDKPPRYIAQVQPAPGRYAGHRNGILGQAIDLNISDWCRRYAAFQAPPRKEN